MYVLIDVRADMVNDVLERSKLHLSATDMLYVTVACGNCNCKIVLTFRSQSVCGSLR